jgi:dipeptidyl aminopeptidase/acylaminoacyl peptidase
MGVVIKHITDPVPEILDFDPTLPSEVDDFIKKALAKDKDDRFATVIELARALNLIAFGEEGAITEAAATKIGTGRALSSGSRLGVIIGGVVLLLALLGGFIFKDKLFGAAAPASTPVPVSTATNTAVPPTATESLPTATLEKPSPTQELSTAIPIPGGTDKVAFISGKEIWVMNTDGTGVAPVTNNGSAKSYLGWMPDGKSLMFLTGNCAYSVDSETRQTETIFCLDPTATIDGPRLSPDGSMLAISLNRELLIVPFNRGELSRAQNKGDLLRIENSCSYTGASTKDMRWSSDGKQIAVVFIDTTDRVYADRIRVLDVSNCAAGGIFAVDQFPSKETPLSGYQNDPSIPGFDWDGTQRFILNDVIRNEGFGNLYLYDMGTHSLELFNPVDDSCCYRDARWSPDGQYVLFMFQDIRQGSASRNQLYFVSFDDLLNGQPGTPIPLPVEMFASQFEQPGPAFRPVQ